MQNATHFDYFASGTNQAGQIAALRAVGCNVGVAANELKRDGEAELLAMAGTGLLVFVDSGAFGEVAFPKEGGAPIVKKAITANEWDKRLALYERLAPTLGEQLYVVAPDRVGCQRTTLELLARYAGRMQALAALGARIIVPLQRGELTAIDFDRRAGAALGLADYVRGIPLKKNATTWDGYLELAAALPAGTRIHLLGKGPGSQAVKGADGRGHGFDDFLAAAAELAVTCDSVAIRRMVGRTNGPGKGPRILTQVQDRIRAELGLPAAWEAKLKGAAAYRVHYLAVREVFLGLPELAATRRAPVQLELLAA